MNVLFVTYKPHLTSIPQGTINALKELGHTVTIFFYTTREEFNTVLFPRFSPQALKDRTIAKENEQLLDTAKHTQPDVLLTLKGETIAPETIDKIRRATDTKTIYWAPDDPRKFATESRRLAPAYDEAFTCCTGCVRRYRSIGVKARFLPFGFDPKTFHPRHPTTNDRREYGSAISFVGSRYADRIPYLNAVADMPLRVWGPGWKNWFRVLTHDRLWYTRYTDELKQKCRGRRVSQAEFIKIIHASEINLNLHDTAMIRCGMVTLRTFELTGSGCFMLSDWPKGIEKLFKPGKEIVCHKNDPKELRELCAYYLEHDAERQRIVKRGHKRALRDFTYAKLLRTALRRVKR